jgi:hypothetical protein
MNAFDKTLLYHLIVNDTILDNPLSKEKKKLIRTIEKKIHSKKKVNQILNNELQIQSISKNQKEDIL